MNTMFRMRFHVLALPHTVTSKEYCACAFTQKVLKLCAMLHRRGHTVYHYGHKDSEVECTEVVHITDNEILQKAYGTYDWRKDFFKHNNGDYAHQTFYQRAIVEVGKRKQKGDFLLCFWGQRPVADAHKDLIVVEPGIGCFNKLFAPFNVFESHAVMNCVYGIMDNKMPAWYDCIIPNYFDPADFEFREKKGDYFLFLGRLIRNKGLPIAVDIAFRTGTKLIVAGQGDYASVMGGPPPPFVEVVGYADVAKRRELLAGAKALIQASYYSEPFGGTVIEAYMSGTPVITTDWGVFPETVIHGVTGYRCRTMDHFVWAARTIDKIRPAACHEWAMKNYSCDRVVLMYEEYFKMLADVHKGKGFYEIHNDRKELDWLKRYLPVGDVAETAAPAEPTFQTGPTVEPMTFTMDA
jgi:glycosyltransferase involved in cell wall biosynthesis